MCDPPPTACAPRGLRIRGRGRLVAFQVRISCRHRTRSPSWLPLKSSRVGVPLVCVHVGEASGTWGWGGGPYSWDASGTEFCTTYSSCRMSSSPRCTPTGSSLQLSPPRYLGALPARPARPHARQRGGDGCGGTPHPSRHPRRRLRKPLHAPPRAHGLSPGLPAAPRGPAGPRGHPAPHGTPAPWGKFARGRNAPFFFWGGVSRFFLHFPAPPHFLKNEEKTASSGTRPFSRAGGLHGINRG